MTVYNDLRIRLESFYGNERGEFTDIIITALIAADNMIRALDDFNEDLALFKDYKPDDILLLEAEHGKFKRALEAIAHHAPDHFNDSQYAEWVERVAREALS